MVMRLADLEQYTSDREGFGSVYYRKEVMFYRMEGIICQCAVSFAPSFFDEIEKSQSTWPENSEAISGSILRCLIRTFNRKRHA